jgi:hypothetical protein
MGEALDGLDMWFTALFATGLVVLTFIVSRVVAAIARRSAPLPTAVGIGVLAGTWSGFMSAGEILKSFDAPAEQLCPLLAFGLVTCAARIRVQWPRARRVGLLAAVAVMSVQAVLMAGDLSALAAGRLTRPGQEYTLPQPRAVEWWLLAAAAPVLLTGLAVLTRLRCLDGPEETGPNRSPAHPT